MDFSFLGNTICPLYKAPHLTEKKKKDYALSWR